MSNRVPSEIRFRADSGNIAFAKAAEGDEKQLRTFEGVAYTGALVGVGGWPYPVITELKGGRVSKKPRPSLRDHDTSKIVGHSTSIDLSATQLTISGVVSAVNEHAREVIESADNGFPWQMSIGASVKKVVKLEEGESAVVNGRKVSGPVYIVRQWELNEVSFVALGADDDTSAKVAASAACSTLGVLSMTYEKWAADKGFDDVSILSQKAQDSLKQQFEIEQNVASDPPPTQQKKASSGDGNSLDDIAAQVRLNQARKQQITQLAGRFITENPSRLDEIQKRANLAMEGGTSPTEFELEMLREMRPQTGGLSGRRRDGGQVTNKVIEAAVCKAGGLSSLEKEFDAQTLELSDKHFRNGIGLCEMLQIVGRENGCHESSVKQNLGEYLQFAFPGRIQQSGFSTLSLPGILSAVANKFVRVAFNNVESVWRAIAAIRSVTDFKQINTYSLTGDLTYEKVGPSGDIKHGTLGEIGYTNQAETFAKMLAITRRDWINDDLGAFITVLMRLGRGGALAVCEAFWTEFMDNSTFFTAGRNNFDDGGTDTPFNADNLIRADEMFRNQTDPDGKPLGAMPRILLVPPALRIPALRLMNSQTVYKDTDNGGSNPWAGAFRVESSLYLSNASFTGNSSKAWYLLADPSDIPVIEGVFLNGRQEPLIESADADFNTLGVQMRGVHDFGFRKQEYRGGVKFKGEA